MAAQTLEVLLTGNADRLKAAFAESSAAAGESSATMGDKLAGIGKAATFAFAGAAVAVGAFSIKMATDFEAAHARLETAVKNTGVAFDSEKSAVSGLDERMQKLGFTETDVEGNLSTLVNATHNANTAIKDMALAADVARGRHIDLSTAVSILAKVETGHVALLGRLGINTKDATGATISQTEAIKRLSEMYGGQASSYAETFGGKIAVLKATFENLGVQIGQVLIPVVEKLGGALADSIQWFEKHKAVAIALGVVIGGPLVASMLTYVAVQTKAAVTGLIDFWQRSAEAVVMFSAGVSEANTNLALETAWMMQAQGATEADTLALVENAGAAGALAETNLLAVGGVAAIGVAAFIAADKLGYFKDGLEVVGVTVSDVARKSIPLLSVEMQKLVASYEESTRRQNEYTTNSHLSSDIQARDTQALAKIHENFQQVLDKSPQYAQKFIDAATAAGIKTADWRAELAKHVDKQRDASTTQQAYNELVDQGTGKIDAQNLALQKNIDLITKQADSDIAAQRSGLAYKDSLDALTKAQQDAANAGGQDAAANEEVQKKTLDATQAAIDHAKAVEASTHKTSDFTDTLKAEAAYASGPLKASLEGYIAKLNEVPTDVQTFLHMNADDATAKINTLIDQLAYVTGNRWEAVVGVTAAVTGVPILPQ